MVTDQLPPVSKESPNVVQETSSPNVRGRPKRECRTPSSYVKYYELNDPKSDEDVVHYVFFVDCDPIMFEETANDDRWIMAMDDEIHSIEKSDT